MERVITIYLGTPNDGTHAEPPYCAMQRWCGHSMPFAAPTVNNLSKHFCEADRLQEDGDLNGPYRLACIVPEKFGPKRKIKYKPSDTLTIYDTWVSYIQNIMAPPRKGMIVSIYTSADTTDYIDSVWQLQYLWRSRDVWSEDACDDNLLTYHAIEPSGVEFKRTNLESNVATLESFAKDTGYNLVAIDYATDINIAYNTIRRARMHFGYAGGTYFLASLTRTPTMAFGLPHYDIEVGWPEMSDHKSRIVGPTGQPIFQTPRRITLPRSLWGQAQSNPGYMIRWVDDELGTRNRPVDWQRTCNDDADILRYLRENL